MGIEARTIGREPNLPANQSSGLFSASAGTQREKRPATSGVLPSQDIRKLIGEGRVRAEPTIEDWQIQPASLDLRLGSRAHRLQASFLPGGRSTVERKLSELSMAELDLSSPTVLEKGCVYLVKLVEELRLPKRTKAKANPKSTTGRLDVFTRLITDYGSEFEHVGKGYHGALYTEIMPRTFPVIVRPGMSLSQIRFIRGRAQISHTALERLDRKKMLVYRDGSPAEAGIRDGGVEVSVNLQRDRSTHVVAYRGKNNAPLVDLAKRYKIDRFWDAIEECPGGQLILNPGDFYILASSQRVRVPPECAAEMVPFDPSVGEFRIHYAGFFDPGFGFGEGEIEGTRAVLEVRAHETPFVIEHDQIVGRLVYSRMLNEPEKIYGAAIGSSYQHQELALSKQFRRSDPSARAPA